VRLGSDGYPLVSGLDARVGPRDVFVPIANIGQLTPGHVQLAVQAVDLGRFERRPREVLLRHDVLHRALIDVRSGRLIRAVDIVLNHADGHWRILGIDAGQRTLPGLRLFTRRRTDDGEFVDWSNIEPFVGHVPSAKLGLRLQKLRRLHPAQIADIVEHASHDEGEEIIAAVHEDPELEADVFEEMETGHQIEFLRDLSDTEAASVLAGMEPDDAADLITEIDRSRRADLLNRLPPEQQRKVRELLKYNAETAGGLMTTDIFTVSEDATVVAVIELMRQSSHDILVIYATDSDGRLAGFTTAATLLLAHADTSIRDVLERVPVSVPVDADAPDIAVLMADFNLIALAVVDDDHKPVGVIAVDDILEMAIPWSWRKRMEGSGG
jgi:CBS domain-containing protein